MRKLCSSRRKKQLVKSSSSETIVEEDVTDNLDRTKSKQIIISIYVTSNINLALKLNMSRLKILSVKIFASGFAFFA